MDPQVARLISFVAHGTVLSLVGRFLRNDPTVGSLLGTVMAGAADGLGRALQSLNIDTEDLQCEPAEAVEALLRHRQDWSPRLNHCSCKKAARDRREA